MDFAEQLRVLEAAHGDPAKLALVTVDLAYPDLTQAESDKLKQGLEAAAIPHWCDEAILSALLDISPEESALRLSHLRKLKVLEPFPARGAAAVNVHEATRLALRKAMAIDQTERFRALSAKGIAFFAKDPTPTGRIEWIYHLLCGDPDRGATELEKMNREWERDANTEDRYALAAALRELEKTRSVEGRARLWVLMGIAWVRVSRGEVAQLADLAAEVLRLARTEADQPAEADAQCLVGDVLQAQGKLAEATVAFTEYRAIAERLATQDLTTERQAALAVAHSRLGGVLEAQGKWREAREAFRESLAFAQSLADQEPSNPGWRRELAIVHSRLGAVLKEEGNWAEALVSLTHYLAIVQQLVAQDPTRAGWQEDLVGAHNQIGDVLHALKKLPDAQAVYEKSLTIVGRLVDQDSSNAGWQQLLASVHNRVGTVLQARGEPEKATSAFEAALAISRWVAEQDSSNAGWRRELAVACVNVARVKAQAGTHAEALLLYEEAASIFGTLAEKAPGFAQWAEEKGTVESELADYRSSLSEAKQSG